MKLIFITVLILIGVVILFFLQAYADKKQNGNDLDTYFDERNRNL